MITITAIVLAVIAAIARTASSFGRLSRHGPANALGRWVGTALPQPAKAHKPRQRSAGKATAPKERSGRFSTGDQPMAKQHILGR